MIEMLPIDSPHSISRSQSVSRVFSFLIFLGKLKMKTLAILLCLATLANSQTKNENGNPTGGKERRNVGIIRSRWSLIYRSFSEIGSPAFDEIVVESTLTVRGKPGSRGGKSLVEEDAKKTESKPENKVGETGPGLDRPKRVADPKRG